MANPSDHALELFLKNLHKLVFIIDRHADQMLLKSKQATFSQFLLLSAIAQCPGFSQQKIATFLNVTPAAVSRQIDSLVAAGCVVRAEDPKSRRAHTVSLTAKGKKRRETMRSLLTRAFAERMKVVSETELHSANGILQKTLAALDSRVMLEAV